MRTLIIIVTFALLQSCTSDNKPLVIAEVQAHSDSFSGAKVVYKSMIRAAQNQFSSDSLNLDLVNQIDKIYYYQKVSVSRGFDPKLGVKLDSIVALDSYVELSEISRKGNVYGAYIKHNEQRVSEILLLQHSDAEILVIDIIGDISLTDVMQNITEIPILLQMSNLDIL